MCKLFEKLKAGISQKDPTDHFVKSPQSSVKYKISVG